MGILYRRENLLEQALEYFTKTYELSKTLQDRHRHATAANNLGTVLFDLKMYAESEKYFKAAQQIVLEIWEKGNREDYTLLKHVSGSYANIAEAIIGRNKYKEALKIPF